jgi:hypothetical protein
VATESSGSSAASTEEGGETATVGSIRKVACRPISAGKKQQILDLELTEMSAREIAAQVGVTESTGRAYCTAATAGSALVAACSVRQYPRTT